MSMKKKPAKKPAPKPAPKPVFVVDVERKYPRLPAHHPANLRG